MKKITGLVLFTIILVLKVQAQVTIGSGIAPHAEALLDLKENLNGTSTKGLLLPRVELEATNDPTPLTDHVKGMLVFNTSTNGAGATAVFPGTYYNTGDQWVQINSSFRNWFYMPSTPISTETITPAEDPDLELLMYDIFISQFTNIPATENSTGAAASILPATPSATDFDYYVTGYDNEVFQISEVTSDGILKYRIIGSASDSTYLNIVFVMK